MTRPKRVALTLTLAALLVGTLWLRGEYVVHSRLAFDEFEHVHAAWLVSQGQRPYVDFFEHHPPLLYFAAALPLRFIDASFEAVIELRLLALVAWLVTSGIVVALVRRTAGASEALATGLFLLTNTLLFQVSSRLYLDTFAAPFVAVSALSVAAPRLRFGNVCIAAVALGIAGLITQKAAVVLPGFFFALIVAVRSAQAQGRNPLRHVILGLSAGLAVSVGLLAVLLRWDGVVGFWRDAIVLNLGWKARHYPVAELTYLVRREGFVTALALSGLILAARDVWRRTRGFELRAVPAVYLASLVLGIVVLPVVWEEYFVLLLPFLCAVAGQALIAGARVIKRVSLEAVGPLLGIVLLLAAIGWRLTISPAPLAPWAAAIAVGAWLLLAGHLLARWNQGPSLHWPLLALPALVYALTGQVEQLDAPNNSEQRARIEYVMRETKSDEPYFDGYSGYGVFRPHAYRYWLLHDEVQAMLGEDELTGGVLTSLESARPRLVSYDHWTRLLPRYVIAYLRANYRATEFPDIWTRTPDSERR